MIRLFVGLELPPTIRDALLAAMGGVIGARWQRDDQLHLTLRFIGEVDRHMANDIIAVLGSVNIQPFDLALAAPGVFDRRGRIETLWVGVTPAAEVTLLARRIDAALVRVGLLPETRAFTPHITVTRGRMATPLGGFPARPLPTTPFANAGFALWESRLGHDGADYTVVERYRAPALTRRRDS